MLLAIIFESNERKERSSLGKVICLIILIESLANLVVLADLVHPIAPPYGYRRGGFGLGSILLAGAAAGALIGKASRNQTQNTTRKTKDVTNDDDGFVW